MFPKDANSPPSHAAAVAVEVAAGPVTVVGAGVTPTRLVSQADIDKVTTVKNKHYPEAEYAKFTPAEKAKHWQLRNPGKERGTGSAGGRKSGISATNITDGASAISSAVSAISALSDSAKRAADEEMPDDDSTNRKNPALARQQNKKTKFDDEK